MQVIDSASGVIRVIQGEATVFLGATEMVLDRGKKAAVEVDRETAVMVRNKRSGELNLITQMGLYIPKPEDEIDQVCESRDRTWSTSGMHAQRDARPWREARNVCGGVVSSLHTFRRFVTKATENDHAQASPLRRQR